MKLLQWNIWYREDIKNIGKTIKKINPDIVCLQELGVHSKYNPSFSNTDKYIKSILGYESFFAEAQRSDNDDELQAIGNGIFSRFPILRTTSMHVQSPTKDFTDYSHEGRIYIEAELQIESRNLTIGTTHLSYTHRFEVTAEKKHEVDKLLDKIKEKKE